MSAKVFLYPILGSLALLFLQYLLIRFIFTPIGLWFGLANPKLKNAPSNPILEREFARSKKWNRHTILGLSKQLDMPEENIEEWLGLKLAEVKNTVLKKFCESAWKFFYYTSETIFGFVVLWDKSWLWDMDDCWRDLSVTNDVWLYFMLCSSFALSQLIGLTFNTKKKDFYLMVFHHVSLITLMTVTGVNNFVRSITVALFLCDTNDILLQVSKMTLYLGYKKMSVCTFIIFIFWWIIIRLILHPFWSTKGFIVDAPRFIPDLSTTLVYYIISSISMAFVIMNVFWTYFIIKTLIKIFIMRTVVDSRSDSDE